MNGRGTRRSAGVRAKERKGWHGEEEDEVHQRSLETSCVKFGIAQVTLYEIATFIVLKGQIAVRFQPISSSSK